jgi:hypothetical protein
MRGRGGSEYLAEAGRFPQPGMWCHGRWQHFYYQTHATGRPLSEDFQAAAPAPGGGFFATGPTLNYGTQKTELYAVHTDGSGLAGTCGDVHPATPLQAIGPQLAALAPALSPRHGHHPGGQRACRHRGHLHQHPARLLTRYPPGALAEVAIVQCGCSPWAKRASGGA